MEKSCQVSSAPTIKIKVADKSLYPDNIFGFQYGDWTDLVCANPVTLKDGQFKLIDLGIAMALPEDYEAYIVPRSSTFLKYGIIQTNGIGIIDNSYRGNDDWWKLPVLATRNLTIPKGTRICQFRLHKKQDIFNSIMVEELNPKSRGGFGSTGD